MPRPPISNQVQGQSNAYSNYVELAKSSGSILCPLHVGDTYRTPANGCRMEDLSIEQYPRLHQYAPVQGHSDLIEGIIEYREKKEGLRPKPSEILVTAGATGGLFGLASVLIEPGDEVIMLAPYWPLFGNAIRHYGGITKSLSVYDCQKKPNQIGELLCNLITTKTVAVYWNTPHNPTGLVFPESWLRQLMDVAARHNLWVVADEVYEHYVFDGTHTYTRPLDPERTISAYSFSKAFGMAGNRCGYLIGPEDVMGRVVNTTRNSFYSVTTSAQIAALRALNGLGDAWAAECARDYSTTGCEVARILDIAPPQGSTFIFLDLSERLGGNPIDILLERCARRGVLLAPGGSFGDFPNFVRICFTSAAPSEVIRGALILKEEIEALN